MDDANLEKLSVAPGKITPKFNRDVTEYAAVVGSNVKELKVNPLTSDSNASYSISGSGGGKTVPLKEGEVTVITVEVTAEDGTIKKYYINATRLSSSDASLSNITFSCGILSPVFTSSCMKYSVTVPYHISSIEIKPIAADKATNAIICDHAEEKAVALNYGEKMIIIDVISPDKTTSQAYEILVLRLKIPWPICPADAKCIYSSSCPVCLGIFHCPKSIAKTKPKHVFCKCCINELTRTTKRNPLNEEPLTGEWLVNEETLEQELSNVMVFCVYSRYGCQEKCRLTELGSHMKQCEHRLCCVEKTEELSTNKALESKMKNLCISCPDCNRSVRTPEIDHHKSHMCSAKLAEEASLPKVPLRPWEKKLQQETSEKSADVLIKKAEEQENIYFDRLRLYGQSRHCDSSSSPVTHLKLASELYATAIKLSPKDARLHFKLGQILEELHFVVDCFGFKQEEEAETPAIDFNQQSRDSSKEDDIQAICEQRGVGRNAPLALQLKAIDEEYHHLLDSQQSDRCEYVQKLYAWKSKQATQDGKVAQQASDEEGSFGKAYLKYTDAVSFAVDNYLYHLHVGRFLLLQGKPEEAVKRLQISLGLKPSNVETRFYLGLALLQLSGGAGQRENEAIQYIYEALEHLLYKLTLKAECPSDDSPQENLNSSELLKHTNAQCLKGFILLGKALTRSSTAPSCYLKPSDVFRTVASLAVRALCSIMNKGELYHQIEWMLLEAHSNFLQLLVEKQKKDGGISREVVARHCDNLSSLVNVSSLPKNSAVLQFQEKTCEQGVLLQPHNSRALYMLGNAQLSRYDNEANNESPKTLEEAEQSFQTSIELEGKPSSGKELPDVIQGQRWWKERQRKVTPKPAASTPAKTPSGTKSSQRVSPTKGTTSAAKGRGRGTAPIKSTGVVKAASRQPASRTIVSTTSQASTTKAGASSKTGAAKTSSTARTTLTKQPAPPNKTPASTNKTPGKTPCRTCSHTRAGETEKKESPSPQPASKPPEMTENVPDGPKNVPTYHPRLGLARVLARKGTDHSQAQTFYQEVITMAPEVHDAYIELGDMLVKSDPLGAVEVYSKYPFPDPLTYDDAYLHGEIVRLLVKSDKFDDERLGTSMIALGKVMGLSVIEKYVEILDSKLKYSKLLMKIYAEVNGKNVDDPELQAFFKFKCWI